MPPHFEGRQLLRSHLVQVFGQTFPDSVTSAWYSHGASFRMLSSSQPSAKRPILKTLVETLEDEQSGSPSTSTSEGGGEQLAVVGG
jgi:hypothetical protein